MAFLGPEIYQNNPASFFQQASVPSKDPLAQYQTVQPSSSKPQIPSQAQLSTPLHKRPFQQQSFLHYRVLT